MKKPKINIQVVEDNVNNQFEVLKNFVNVFQYKFTTFDEKQQARKLAKAVAFDEICMATKNELQAFGTYHTKF